MLIVFGGLPGAGKSTIAKAIAKALNATYLRIDVIEQALKNTHVIADDMGAHGYEIAYAIAESNLSIGQHVVADSVNPIAITRNAWANLAHKNPTKLLTIEVVCSNQDIHRQRIESRISEIKNLQLPTWEQVINRDYEPWNADFKVDTAYASVEESINLTLNWIRA